MRYLYARCKDNRCAENTLPYFCLLRHYIWHINIALFFCLWLAWEFGQKASAYSVRLIYQIISYYNIYPSSPQFIKDRIDCSSFICPIIIHGILVAFSQMYRTVYIPVCEVLLWPSLYRLQDVLFYDCRFLL